MPHTRDTFDKTEKDTKIAPNVTEKHLNLAGAAVQKLSVLIIACEIVVS